MPELTNNLPSNTESNNTLAELEVRSEEVQEIIGRPPHWLIRWGITAFFGVLALVLLSAAVIKYPEVIEAPIRLTAINAPQSLESRTGGKIVRLVAENNTAVDEGTVLAWLESTADHREIMELAELMGHIRDQLINSSAIQIEAVDLSAFGNLGDLQTTFQGFEQAWREYIAYQPGAFFSQQRDMLIQELDYSRQLLGQLQIQKEIQEADLSLAEREFNMQKELAANDFISPVELARAERELASRRLPLQQTESAIISNYVSRTAKEKEIMELDRRMDEQQSVIIQSLNTMISAIEDWKQTYLVTAPYSGQVVFAGIVQENQTVTAGQELFYLKPNSTTYFGELSISQQSFGRVAEGQQVLVRFSGYPYQEYGSVYGEVEYFSDFPVRDSLFFAKVAFPDGLQTSYGQTIPPRNGMLGRAEIITQDMRLLDRVYNNITKELR